MNTSRDHVESTPNTLTHPHLELLPEFPHPLLLARAAKRDKQHCRLRPVDILDQIRQVLLVDIPVVASDNNKPRKPEHQLLGGLLIDRFLSPEQINPVLSCRSTLTERRHKLRSCNPPQPAETQQPSREHHSNPIRNQQIRLL